jgi:predicted ribosome quality control (RQC) complex YloA/Tae2 family protein
MRHELSALELRILAGELNAVKGYYIDQFYQTAERKFRIKLSSKEGKINLNIDVPDYIALSNSGEVSEEATGFAMAARKRLSGAKVSNISLLNNDRILVISFDRKDSGGSLILEMFGRGNLIIVDGKMEVSLALQTHEFADRTVRKGELYKPPKNSGIDLMDRAAVKGVFDSVRDAPASDKLAPYLSKRLGLGNLYLEDAIRRQGLDPKAKLKEVNAKTLEKIRERVEAIIAGEGKALLYLKAGKPEDVAVAEIEKYSHLEKKEMPLNEAIEALYSSSPKEENQQNADVERLESSIGRQEEIIKHMQNEEADCRIKGDFISANVGQIGTLIKAASEKRVSEQELAKLAGGELKLKRLDRAKRVIIIEKGD